MMTMLTKKLFLKRLRPFGQLQGLAESVQQHQRLSTTLFKLVMQREQIRVVVAVVAVVGVVRDCKQLQLYVLNFRLQQCAGSHQSIKGLQ
jgi:hypothetical protein